MNTYNVIIENNGRFEYYDIMPYLRRTWEDFKQRSARAKADGWDDKYYDLPTNYEKTKEWVESNLRYQYWARCEYELILSPWPSYTNEAGESILKKGTCTKIDVFEQCKMNIDIIVNMFINEFKEDFNF